MACPECDRLQAEYERLEKAWEAALESLAANTPTTPLNEYSRLRIAVDEARIAADIAKLDFEHHRRTHDKAKAEAI